MAGAERDHELEADARARQVSVVLETATALSRAVQSGRRTPFAGRTLTRSQMEALFRIAHGPAPVTPGGLAGALGLTAGAVTQAIDGLRADGLVDIAQNPDDARSRVLRLTDPAAAELAEFERDAVARMLPRFEALDDHELGTLADLLDRITEAP